MFDVCFIGHVSWDTVVWQGRASVLRPGGSAFNAGETLGALGASAAVVTAVAREDADTLLAPLREAGVTVFNLPTARTAHTRSDFLGSAKSGEHLQWLVRAADPIELSEGFLPEARAYHLCPLLQEDVDVETVARVLESGALISTDVKSMLFRQPASDGALVKQRPAGGVAQLTGYQMTHSSAAQLATLTSETSVMQAAAAVSTQGVSEVVVTRHEEGAFVLAEGRGYHGEIPPSKADRDPSGLDDVFFATYLWRRLSKDDARKACDYATAAASTVANSEPGETITDERVKAALQQEKK